MLRQIRCKNIFSGFWLLDSMVYQMKPSGVITPITDFGLRDWYAGVMKGAVLGVNPDATIVDITHDIDPGDAPGLRKR